MCQPITGLRPVAKHEVVTEEGVLSVDEGWYICQWNGSPREVSQEEWESIEVGEKWSEAEWAGGQKYSPSED